MVHWRTVRSTFEGGNGNDSWSFALPERKHLPDQETHVVFNKITLLPGSHIKFDG